MPIQHHFSWSAALRDLRADRDAIPPRLIGARSQCEAFSRFRRRPLNAARMLAKA